MHEIDQRDLENLLAITGKQRHEQLHPDVTAAYWTYKRMWDRVMSHAIPVEQLVTIAVFAGQVAPVAGDVKQRLVPELYVAGEFHAGQRVETVWRRKTVNGSFVRLGKEGTVVVLVDGDTTEREIEAALVKPVGVIFKQEPAEVLA